MYSVVCLTISGYFKFRNLTVQEKFTKKLHGYDSCAAGFALVSVWTY